MLLCTMGWRAGKVAKDKLLFLGSGRIGLEPSEVAPDGSSGVGSSTCWLAGGNETAGASKGETLVWTSLGEDVGTKLLTGDPVGVVLSAPAAAMALKMLGP